MHRYPIENLEVRLNVIVDRVNAWVFKNRNQGRSLEYLLHGVAWFVHGFLELHLFPDGNGRTVRLLYAYLMESGAVPFPPHVKCSDSALSSRGRGRNQVAIGIAPINCENRSSESATAIYPICIANCKENRQSLKLIIAQLNKDKKEIKDNGITVDNKHYTIKFTGNTERAILENIESIVRTGLSIDKVREYYEEAKGVDSRKRIMNTITFHQQRMNFLDGLITKGCFTRDYGTNQETVNLKHCKVLDDFLHEQQEHWNTKQNMVEQKYVELTTAAQAKSFEPKRKREMKVAMCPNVFAEYVAELEVDFFVKIEIDLHDVKVLKKSNLVYNKLYNPILVHKKFNLVYNKFQICLSYNPILVHNKSNLVYNKFQICLSYNPILVHKKFNLVYNKFQICLPCNPILVHKKSKAKTACYKFGFKSIQCKEWGFLLKKLFDIHLGTGDYGHLCVDHSAMLLRQFRSFREYSGQGFEASHKLHRAIFSRATNHDSSGPGQSLNQILTHYYTYDILRLRYMFRQAMECIHT
ncbi:hypothetical protein QZH41_017200, partial [Actinostola sp. cb2023]